MTRTTTIQTNFSSGELDPKLRSRSNLEAYGNGAKKMRDVVLLAAGGAERRPGTIDTAPLPDRTRLIEYEFKHDQRYILALYAGGLKIYDDSGVLLQTLAGAPWTLAQLGEVSYSYSGDVVFLTHSTFFVRLVRTAIAAFTLEAFAFAVDSTGNRTFQPYFKFAADDVTLSVSATTGAVTITASGTGGWGGFSAAHVGTRLRVHDVEIEITAITDATHASGTVKGELRGYLDIDPFKSTKGSGEVEVQHPFHGFSTGGNITLAGANDLGMNDDGTAGIEAAGLTGTFAVTVKDEHYYTIATGDTAEVTEDGGGPGVTYTLAGLPTRQWLEQAIGTLRGFPQAVTFHEQRLCLAGTPSIPDGFFLGNSLIPYRFDVGEGLDADSIQGAAGIENISQIRHLVSNGDLQIFTVTAEAVFVRDGDALTPAGTRVKGASKSGSSFVTPRVFDNATVFVQANGLSVSEFTYSDQLGRYVATPVSLLAGHLLASGVTDSAVSRGTVSRSEQYAFFPLGSGSVALFHSIRQENIAGWVLWTLGGGALVHSVCTIGEKIFLAVERDGEHRLYRLAAEDPAYYTLDGAIEHTSIRLTRDWLIDEQLRGRTVAVRSELGFYGIFDIPEDGVFQAPLYSTRLLVGDPFYLEIETLPPSIDTSTGQRDRLLQRIVRAVIEVDETASLVVDGSAIAFRNAGSDPSAAVMPFTGPYEFRVLGYSRTPTVLITQQEPSFARVLGMTLEVSI